MTKPVLWQVRTKHTSWGPGCTENIARYFEKQEGYEIRALVPQGNPIAWAYEWYGSKQFGVEYEWHTNVSLDEIQPGERIRNVRPLYE